MLFFPCRHRVKWLFASVPLNQSERDFVRQVAAPLTYSARRDAHLPGQFSLSTHDGQSVVKYG